MFPVPMLVTFEDLLHVLVLMLLGMTNTLHAQCQHLVLRAIMMCLALSTCSCGLRYFGQPVDNFSEHVTRRMCLRVM